MSHKAKRLLILVYTALTVFGIARSVLAPDAMGLGIAGPETVGFIFWVVSVDLTGLAAVIRHGLTIAALLLEVASPLCACFRVYGPFRGLLALKALFAGVFAILASGEGVVVAGFLLHVAILVLGVWLTLRKPEEDRPAVEVGGITPGDMRLHPALEERPGGGFPG